MKHLLRVLKLNINAKMLESISKLKEIQGIFWYNNSQEARLELMENYKKVIEHRGTQQKIPKQYME